MPLPKLQIGAVMFSVEHFVGKPSQEALAPVSKPGTIVLESFVVCHEI